MSEYITQADYRRQKTALTRAINSGNPEKVLATVEKTLEEWSGKVWPDAWSRWSVALYDAWLAYEQHPYDDRLTTVVERFKAAYGRFA